MDSWQQAADVADLDEKITAARMRRPARITYTSTGWDLLAEAQQQATAKNLAALPSVPTAIAHTLRAELRRDKLADLYADVHPGRALAASAISAKARAEALYREVHGDSRPRQRVPRGTTAATAAKLRQARRRRPVSASASRRADQQRAPLAAMRAGQNVPVDRVVASGALRGAGDFTRRWDGLRRIGTVGYHS